MRRMRRALALTLALFAAGQAAVAADGVASGGGSIVARGESATYPVSVSLVPEEWRKEASVVVTCIPIPESDQYQTVAIRGKLAGEPEKYKGRQGRYRRRSFSRQDLRDGVGYAYDMDVTLYAMTTDFGRIKKLFPYDKEEKTFTTYTRTLGEYVVPDHPLIAKTAKQLGGDAKDDLEYARKAYEHVAEHFTFVPRKQGEKLHFLIKPLEHILDRRGGNSGDLTSVFVSLLRSRGIPARHVFGYDQKGNTHARAEFYLQQYGWIPVDVTYASLREGDFFGQVELKDALIVFSYDAYLPVRLRKKSKNVSQMQTSWSQWDKGPEETDGPVYAEVVTVTVGGS